MEKMISVYWFVILILVAGGIAAMVFTFYNHPYDVREAEATILIGRVADCIASSGKINDAVLNSDKGAFLETCNLNFDSEPELNQGQYYLEASITDFSGTEKWSVSKGNPVLETHCNPQAKEEIKRLSRCVRGSFYALDDAGNQDLVNILAVVKKTEKNAK